MAIAEEYVVIDISALNATHYVSLGYQRGKSVQVRVEDLPRGSKLKVTHICDNCGKVTRNKIYRIIRRDRINGKDFCGVCMYDISVKIHQGPESWGERVVESWLIRRGVKFTSQVRRKGLTGLSGRPLMFDFAVLGDNGEPTSYIEYDGEQHFMPVDFDDLGDEYATKALVYQQEHDRRKDRYCVAAGTPLIRIKYDMTVTEIERVLSVAVLDGK